MTETLPRPPPVQPDAKPVGAMAHSAWQSPVPYVFGALAAMFALVSFALLIVVWSYLSSGSFEGSAADEEPGGGNDGNDGCRPPSSAYRQSLAVIMAGDDKPSFLATPTFADKNPVFDGGEDGKANDDDGEDGVTCTWDAATRKSCARSQLYASRLLGKNDRQIQATGKKTLRFNFSPWILLEICFLGYRSFGHLDVH
ncbi:hypothetical protein HPP92_010754 [Vanilla planifolia]|uniref:Uncharacterized protein n=1 Tax=Vanilla planifolia TaxID=51239 RepID=A0A835QZ79_VANPL|nr:hypothetical protein HPP92_010754 [Vanilla planifolia]